MKTKVEIEGYEIEISFEEGMISVTAQKDDEVVEEFSINIEEGQEEGDGQGESDIKGFGDYDEEEDFSGEDLEDDLESDDDDDDDDDDEEGAQEEREGAALESFQSFISKK
jgi:hypothetical protein